MPQLIVLPKQPFTLYTYDPGGTTGWARFTVNPEAKRAEAMFWGEHELWRGIDEQVLSPTCQAVLYENIVPRSLDFNPVGIQVIGVLRYLCERASIAPLVQPNAMLRGIERWGTYDFSDVRSPHARDALMHGYVYLRKRGFTVARATARVL